MKKTKLFLGSMLIACAFSACSQVEEIEVANPEATLANRAQVNLVLSSPAETRLQVNANGNVGFTQNDLLGAVMVDGGYSAEGWNKVNWNIIDGHAGNNKWFWDGEKFSTEGTTAVGAWLFYSMYDEAMTSKRAGVEFSFPQIQDGAADLSKVANNNINFHVSPVMLIDGQEGDAIDIPVKYASVYNYLNVKLAFEDADVTSVEKIIVSAKKGTSKFNQTKVTFPAVSKVVNSAMPKAKMSLGKDAPATIKVPNHDGSVDSKKNPTFDAADQAIESMIAYAALSDVHPVYNDKGAIKGYAPNWDPETSTVGTLTEAVGEKAYDYLVVDCGAHSKDLAVVDGKFSTWMLMPAGVYYSITLKIYTNNGVYTKTINTPCSYEETDATVNKKTYVKRDKQIILRPQAVNSIANVEKEEADAEVDYVYVKKADFVISDIVTNTAELINLINSIKEKGSYDVNILSQAEVNGGTDEALGAHALVINKDVMDAIVAKEAEVKGDIQLVFKGEKVAIAGNASSSDRLNIHDMTFTEGCDVVSGYITTSADINFADKVFTVKSGANATFGTNLEEVNKQIVADEWNKVVIEKDAKATVIGDIVANEFVNNGTMAVNNTFNLDVAALTNAGILSVKGEVEADVFTAAKDSETTNAGTMTIGSAEASEFNGAVVNKADINIIGVAVNNGSIKNTADAKFMVDGATMNGDFTNNGDIENYGKLVAQSFNTTIQNSIHNLGTIESKAGATTWITTNSKFDETTVATNAAAQVMGVVIVDERNADLTIAKTKQQGYKVYEVAAADLEKGVLSFVKGDVFNKVILSDAAELNVNLIGKVQYVETSNNLTLPAVANATSPYYPVKELTFTDDATFVAAGANIWELNVAKGVNVKIPVGSKVYVMALSDNWLKSYGCADLRNTTTELAIHNYGEIWNGGKLTTDLSENTVTYQSTLVDAKGNVVAKGKFYGNSGADKDAYTWGTK